MSTCEKQARPNRCYCRIRDEGVSLNDIAKMITTLNYKTLQLRNEVNAFNNDDDNDEKKLSKKFVENTHGRLSARCYDRRPDIVRSNVKRDHLLVSEECKTFSDTFRNNLINNYKIKQETIDNKTLKNIIEINNLPANEELQMNIISQTQVKNNTDCNPISTDSPKIREKKISRGAQFDSTMERKRKRNFLNCFKTEPGSKEYKLLHQNKKAKRSQKNNICMYFDLQTEENELLNNRRIKDENMFKNMQQANNEGDLSFEQESAHDKKNAFDKNGAFKPVKTESKEGKKTLNQLKKRQENNILKSEQCEDKTVLQEDIENKCQTFECLVTSRMGGGAEFRGNSLISDFNNKIQKINLYKNVKFDAKNVKRRLDACISELNGIIEDISLIFPDTDILKE